MRSQKWIIIVFTISFISVLSVFSVNYIVDPFNIFHTKIFKTEFLQNERFIKVELLENKKNEINGLMFGSSIIGTAKTSTLEKYIPNQKFYNFAISSANLYDYEKHLEYFINNKFPIKTLYMQIDIANMESYGRKEYDYLRKFHPYLTGDDLNSYYKQYLGGLFYFYIKEKIKKNIKDDSPTIYNWETGVWRKPIKDELVKKDCNKYIIQEESFNKNNIRTRKYSMKEKNIRALKKIKQLCIDNRINLIVFLTPHNQHKMNQFIIEEYLEFLKDIVSVVPYYNFSGYNSITVNDCNYYELNHYRPNVGDLIAAKIFKDTSIDVPDDFGIYVTKENINNHINYMRDNFIKYDKDKKRY